MEPPLGLGERRELGRVGGLERQRGELARGRAELLPHAVVVVDQRAVVEDELLAHDPLERRRLLEQQARGARGLRGLQHLLAALRREAVEREDELRERVEQRQADEQEAHQDELEERARVVHEAGPRL